MSDKVKTIAFVIVLCVMCSIILTFGNVALKERQEQNKRLDHQINILLAADLMSVDKLDADNLHKLYYEHITELYINPAGDLSSVPDDEHDIHVYIVDKTEKNGVKQIILPFTVSGMWAPISGYLALSPDLESVTGFTVYDHGETAGLGAEIVKEWFQNQWRGKKLYDKNGLFTSVKIAKGSIAPWSSDYDFTVDGISGATATGNALSKGLKEKLLAELAVLQKVDWRHLAF